MRKFLSFILAVVMILSLASTIVISAGAADAPTASITVPIDKLWTECQKQDNFHDKTAQTRVYGNAGSYGAGGFMFSYGEGNKATATDISAMEFIEFDVYVSDVSAIAEVEFSFELSSSGTSDKLEVARKFKGKDTGWANGWNHVKWSLEDFNSKTGGTFDPAAWNFIRWYNDTTLTVASFLEIGIANVAFTTYDPNAVVPEEDNGEGYATIEELGDAFLADFNNYGETNAAKETFQPDSSAPVKTALANAEMLAKWNWLWVYMLNHLKETNPGETSAYLTDTYPVLEKMIAGNTTAILDSANARTSIRSYIHGFLNNMKGCGDLNTDFSKFSPDFSSEEEQAKLLQAQAGAGAEEDDGSIKVALDGPWDQCWVEANFHDQPAQVRIYGNGGTHTAGGFMFRYGEGGTAEAIDISGMDYLEFDVYVSDPAVIANVEFSFELTSAGGSDAQESAKKFKGQDTGWEAGWNHVKWALTEFDVKNGEFDATKWNFIRWYNDTTLTAGGYFEVGMTNVKFTAKSAEEMDAEEATKTEHSIPLWGANQSWGNGYVVDNENQLAGSGCISLNLNGVEGVYAPEVGFADVDATGMDTLEFDIYLSDLAILDHFASAESGSLEICSGGSCDQGEKAISIFNLVSKLKSQGAVVGWNHVAISIKSMENTPGGYGDFTVSCINYVRFYWTGLVDCAQDWVFKLDNFRMTDAQKVREEEEAQKEAEIISKYAELLTKIEALKAIKETGVTAENYEAAKAQYDAVRAEYDAVPSEEQSVLAGTGSYDTLIAVKKVLDDYQKEVNTLEENKDLIAALEALAVYKDAAAFTADNYAEAKAAIEAARTAVDALAKAAKNLLKEKGYIAHLEAAEAAMPAEAPGGSNNNDAGNNTDNNTGNTDHTDNTQKGGCGGVLTVGAVATMVLAGAWVTMVARKKED